MRSGLRILVDITHPAYAHFFIAVIPRLEAAGHRVLVTSRQKDVTLALLDAAAIEHRCLSTARTTLPGLVLEMIVRVWRLCRMIRRFRPDVILARDGAYACQAGWLMRVPSISFDDTDDATLQHLAYFPFAWRIYTDRSYRKRIGAKQRFYRGVSSLAYLDPQARAPDPEILETIGATPDQRLVLCRLVSWTSNHDVGHRGFDRAHLSSLLDELSRHARVLLTSETPLPADLEPYRISVPPQQVHRVMARCCLYIGESATMAAECAVLGAPAVHVSTRRLWYTDQLEEHGLVYNVRTAEDCLSRALEILGDSEASRRYAARQERYLAESDDLIEVVLHALDEVRQRSRAS